MQEKFEALSTWDQLRVFRFLTQGEGPSDPELAAVTLEVGKRYERRGRVLSTVMRWSPMTFALFFTVVTLPGALDGEVWKVVIVVVIVLAFVGSLMLNPWTRPKNVARSVEASSQVVAKMVGQKTLPDD